MRVLVTGGNSELGKALAAQLSTAQGVSDVRVTDRSPLAADIRDAPKNFFHCALGDDASTAALVEGVDQIIHAEPFVDDSAAEGDDWVDHATRCTYNLLHAAAVAGCTRCICISSLAVFNSIDRDYAVTAGWRARPRPVKGELGPHLAEFVCREFAHVGAIAVAVARLGAFVETTTPLADRPRFWTRKVDAVTGLVELLTAPPPPADGEGFFVGGGTANMFHPHNRIFTLTHIGESTGGAPTPPVPAPQPFGAAAAPAPGDRVVLFGANGLMGPETVRALRTEPDARPVLVTDVGSPGDKDQMDRKAARAMDPIDYDGDTVTFAEVDVSDRAQVWEAANGSTVLVNCSVARWQRKSSFDVNCRGVMNCITAAIACGHDRFVNTGPHWTHTGPQEPLAMEYGIIEEQVPHPGAGLYGISKGCGQELAKIYSEHFPIHVITHLYNGIGTAPEPEEDRMGLDGLDLAVTYADAGRAVRCAIEVSLQRLPSRCEIFFISADLPHGKYRTTKAKELLDWEPHDKLEKYFRKSAARL